MQQVEAHTFMYQIPVPIMNSLRRWSIAVLCLTFSTGCVRLLLDRSIEYARFPFQFGTNATIRIERNLRHTGNYVVYVLFAREGEPSGNDWPREVPVRLSILVSSPGQILAEKE